MKKKEEDRKSSCVFGLRLGNDKIGTQIQSRDEKWACGIVN